MKPSKELSFHEDYSEGPASHKRNITQSKDMTMNPKSSQKILLCVSKSLMDKKLSGNADISIEEISVSNDTSGNFSKQCTRQDDDDDPLKYPPYPFKYVYNHEKNRSNQLFDNWKVVSEAHIFGNLQSLDLSRSSLCRKAIQILFCNPTLDHLKSLNLTENHIGNEGIKSISEASYLNKLQILALQNVNIDHQGVKYISQHQNWANLKELDISQNDCIGDLGAAILSLNQIWMKLQKISLRGCNASIKGVKCLNSKRNFKDWIDGDVLTVTVLSQQNTNEVALHKFEENSDDYRHRIRNHYRGGCPENDTPNVNYSELFSKLHRYKEKILNDEALEREFDLYIETCARPNYGNFDRRIQDGHKSSYLAYDIGKYLLHNENAKNPKMLLLTGEAGIGKTFFCKHFQRELLSDWSQPQNQVSDNSYEKWFPLYIELSGLQDFPSDIIPEILAQELYLTQEEIFLLQYSKPSDTKLPKLLFIFDGYDSILDKYNTDSLQNDRDDTSNNFWVLNKIEGTSWQNAKFIITYRGNNLLDGDKRDLLFASMRSDRSSIAPEALLLRTILPFTDEQVTCYLKKYCCCREIESLEEELAESSSKRKRNSILTTHSLRSWQVIDGFKKGIDRYNLREMTRLPFILWMITVASHDTEKRSFDTAGYSSLYRSKVLTLGSILDYFVNKIIKSTAKTALSENFEENLKHQARKAALNSIGYPISDDNLHNVSVLKSHCPLFEWDNQHSKIQFRCSLLNGYFVAKSIEEEMIRIVNKSKPDKVYCSFDYLLNQKLLSVNSSMHSIILGFLRDAMTDKTFTADIFINQIRLSREQTFEKQNINTNPQEATHSRTQSSHAISASNLFTILNASGYDFSHQDFSDICAPGATLANGTFKGTNFTNSNLQGVDFTGACLKDAKFVNSNMNQVEFGEIPRLKIESEKISGIAYSNNGKYFAVDTDSGIMIFKIFGNSQFKEFRRLAGHFPSQVSSPFSIDGNQIVIADTGNFWIWDISSGNSLHQFDIPSSGIQKRVEFYSAKNDLVCCSDKWFQKYNIKLGSWTFFCPEVTKSIKNYDSNLGDETVMLIADENTGIILCSTITGKRITKQRHQTAYCKFSPNGKQIASGTSSGGIHISDCVRGHTIKIPRGGEIYVVKPVFYCGFKADGLLIFSASQSNLVLRDVASADVIAWAPIENEKQDKFYAFSPDVEQFATTKDRSFIYFRKFSETPRQINHILSPIQGVNDKGISLKGTIANSSIGLSQGNISLLQEKGDYGLFNEEMIGKLFHSDSIDPGRVTEVVLRAENLTSIQAIFIGRDLRWKNLQKLDLSNNNIGNEGGKVIAANKSWPELTELILESTGIESETVTIISNNLTWKKLKMVCLLENPIVFYGQDLFQIIENLAYETLVNFQMPQVKFNRVILQYLKCSSPQKILEVLLSDMKYSHLITLMIGMNSNWSNLRKLDLSNNSIGEKSGKAIGSNTAWANLEDLDLSNGDLGTTSCIALGKNIIWQNLRVLNLSGNRIGAEGARQIAMNSTWNNLQALRLGENFIGDQGAEAVSKNKTWKYLQTLELNDNEIYSEGARFLRMSKTWVNLQTLNLGTNEIGAQGTTELSRDNIWTSLQTLILKYNSIGDLGTQQLSKDKTWTSLKVLDLSANQIGNAGVQALSQNTAWIKLEVLDLQSNLISVNGVASLNKNTTWINLQVLNLYANKIGDLGAVELSRNVTWINLLELNLAWNSISDEGVTELSKNLIWKQLRTLDLHQNSIGYAGVRELRKNAVLTNLQVLNLHSNKLGDKGAAELSKNRVWINLNTLNIGSNEIGPEGITELSKNTVWVNLQDLNLQGNFIGDQGAVELCKNMTWTKLSTLNLCGNMIGDQGCSELSKNTVFTQLKDLNLQSNLIGENGAAVLSENLRWKNLESLNLYHNAIGDNGIVMLSKNATWKTLKALNLAWNSISDRGATELMKNTSWAKLETIDLQSNSISDGVSQKLKHNPLWELRSLLI